MNLAFTARVALGLSFLLCGMAEAQTLYKMIDKNGKVTYSESPPKYFDGQVIRIDINPNANTATLAKPAPPSDPRAAPEGSKENPANPSKEEAKPPTLEEFKQKLERAKQDLQEATDNPGESDVTRVGKVGGGSRPVFSESYQQRIAKLEQAVKAAEEDVRRAER